MTFDLQEERHRSLQFTDKELTHHKNYYLYTGSNIRNISEPITCIISPIIAPMKCLFHTTLHTIPNDFLRSLWILTVAVLNHIGSEGNVAMMGTAGVVGYRG